MTRFVDVPAISRIVSHVGLEKFFRGLTAAIREDFRRWEDFDKSARSANHSNVGVIELMPVANGDRYAFKYVNGHPANTKNGLSTVMAFGALAEVSTGYPLLLSELTLTTAFRTAATSVMAAKALAKPTSKVMAIIGCGAQSEFQVAAFHLLLGIEEVRIFDIDPAATRKLEQHLTQFPSLRVVSVDSPFMATHGADIVTTVTADKNWATVLTPDMIESGMHINAIGGDCPGKTELHADVLLNASVFVEYEPQTRIEGDIQQLPADFEVCELWRVLVDEQYGRSTNEQITVFDSVGFALEDFSALRYVYDMAQELDVGETIALVPDLNDPKDLFALVSDPFNVARSRQVA